MFHLTQTPAYWWPVTFRLPSGTESGKFVDHGFEVLFKRLDDEQHDELMAKTRRDQLSDREFAKLVVTNWRGVLDANDVEVPFAPEAFSGVLKTAGVPAAIATQYLGSRSQAVEKK